MTWKDYKVTQTYAELSIGILDEEFVLQNQILSGMASDFYKIIK